MKPRTGTATVLFTDLVGSTELMTRLGDSAFDEVRRAHFAALRRTILRAGGEEVKTLGDGVLAVFGSAADAVACAVAMQQAVQRHASPAPLAIRIGIGVGDVRFEEGDVFGTPVVEAARLVEAGRPGQILATATVRVVAGGRAGVTFSDVGPLPLKGLPEPVPTCEVGWEALPLPLPLPDLLTDMGPVFVAREAEMAQLEQLWREAVAGELRLGLLAGEPGVGKTRLAAELAGRVHDGGGTVLAGRCDEDLGVPYQPFVEALRHFVDHIPADELAGRLGRYGGELARLVPEMAERVPGLAAPLQSDPETERYRLFDAVAAWLAAASEYAPILLVLDDLQWAAGPTLLLLRHVVSRRIAATRLLVVGTYRDTELGHDHPLVEVLADLRRQEGVERFSLTGFDQSGVTRLMEQRAGRALAEEELPLARAIYEETEGNPFFVREVLRNLAESGTVGRPVEQVGIPEGVRDVVGRRLARLSRDTNHVLRLAAVVGTEFEVPVLQEAEHLDEDELVSALEEAGEARLVVGAPGDRYRFAHSLVRHTLYEGISAARRVRLHLRVGEAIERVHAESLDEYMPALVHHWARAGAPRAETARAVRYAIRAGDLARAQLAHAEAVGYYRQALDLLEAGGDDDAKRAQVLVSLGEAQHRMGEPGYRATILQGARLAERLGDADCLARAALAGYRGMWSISLGVDRERVAALEAALQAREPEDVIRARLLADLAVELMFADRQRRWALSDEALRVARRLGDRPTLGHVLLSRIAAIWEPVALAERRAHVGELLALAEDLGDPFVKVWAELYGFETAMEIGELDEADRLLAEAQRTASEVERALRWFAEFPRAGRALFAGRVAEADVLAHDALEIGRATQPPHEIRIIYGVQRFEIRVEQDRADELLPALMQAAATDYPESRAMLAQAYCELGRLQDARAVFDPLMAVLSDVLSDPNWILAVTRAASVCADLDDRGAAGQLYPLLAPYDDRIAGNGVVWIGSVAHYLGVLATTLEQFDDAERHLVAADTTHERMHAVGWRARTQLARARLLLRRGQPEDFKEARQLLSQVNATARDLGLVNLERRAAELR